MTTWQGYRVIDWVYAERKAWPVSRAAKKIAGRHRLEIKRSEMSGYVFFDSPHNIPRMARTVHVVEG